MLEALEAEVGSGKQHRRDLQSIRADGAFFSAMVGLGETYVPAFAIALGMGSVAAGLLATLPMLAGAVLQLVTPMAVRHLGSYRRWVVGCARLQAFTFVPLIAGGLLGGLDLVWVACATVAYWGFGMATGPAWNAWVTSLVEPGERAEFFARRTRLAQGALFVSLIAAGLVLETGRGTERELVLYAGLFTVALASRLVSSAFLARQSEAPEVARGHRVLGAREVLAEIREAGSMPVLAYLLLVQLAANIASPFFTPYMLGPLGLSYTEFMVLTAAAFVSRIAVMPLLGRLAKRRGVGTVLWIGGLGIIPLPSLWIVSHDFVYLLVVQLAAGAAWAALEFATMLSFFDHIHERSRASVLTGFNLANALMIAFGSLVGAQLFRWMGGNETAFFMLFIVSSAARLLTLLILRRAHPADFVPDVFPLRDLAVRPSAGAVQRPILAGLSSDAPESAVPRGREG